MTRPRRSILLVVHALPPAEHTGTPLVAYGYARELAEAGWGVTVLSASVGASPWAQFRPVQHDSEAFVRLTVPPSSGMGTSWLDAWSAPVTRSGDPFLDVVPHVARALGFVQPDIVHVVDNVSLPLSIPEVCSDLGIPVVRSVSALEDLCTLVVPVSRYSGPSGFCDSPITVEQCARCVGDASSDRVIWLPPAAGQGSTGAQRHAELRRRIAAQRARAVHLYRDVYDMVLFASEKFRTYFEQTLPLDPLRARVLAMGVDVPAAQAVTTALPDEGAGSEEVRAARRRAPRPHLGAPVTFLVAGNTHAAKGTGAVVSAFRHRELAERGDWRLLLAGGGDRRLYGPLLDDDRVHDHGPYGPDELAVLCARADVGISASVFETFHRVTREYLLGGLPVIGSMAFGVSDVVVDGFNGLLFDHADGDGLRRVLVRLLEEPALLRRLAAAARATKIRSVAEEVAELVSVYEGVMALSARRSRPRRGP